MEKIDHMDKSIIKMLQQDGRTSNTEIARELNISESTVRNRINRLKENEIIQIVAVADPFKIGLELAAIIKIRAEVDKVETVAQELKNIEEVWYIALATGDSTFDVEVYTPNIPALDKLLRDKIWKIEGVKETETSIILSYLKRNYRWKF